MNPTSTSSPSSPNETGPLAPLPPYLIDRENPSQGTKPIPISGNDSPHSNIPRVIMPKGASPDRRVFRLLQLWEGTVTKLTGEDFSALLTDKTCPTNPQEIVVIDREEVPNDDLRLIKPGAIFYWSIGYEDEPGRPRRRISQIRFRRLPGWSRRELERAARRSADLAEVFE